MGAAGHPFSRREVKHRSPSRAQADSRQQTAATPSAAPTG
eukprot:gene37519-25771_t